MTRRLACLAFTLTTLCATGCGSQAHVLFQLRGLLDEDPFAGISELAITLSGDGERVASMTATFDGQPIELPSPGDVTRVVIDVEGQANDGAVTSQGRGRAAIREGAACCLLVCFCSAARFTAGECTCGEDRCATSCAADP